MAGGFKVLRANHWEASLNENSGVFWLLPLKSNPCSPEDVREEEGIHTPQTDSLVPADIFALWPSFPLATGWPGGAR